MNKKNNINWEEWGKENQKEIAENNLKKTKSSSISYLESQGNYFNRKEEIFHARWETYLTSSEYWKNWREKINSFKTEKEIAFYTDRLRAFIEFLEKYTCKDKNNYYGTTFEDLQQWDPLTTPQLLEKELKRLENISEEEFNKTDKWRKSGPIFKELSTEEMLNDPWFNKQIDNIFGLEKNQTPPQTCAFCSKTIDPLQYICANDKYFCNSECMTNRKDDKPGGKLKDYKSRTKEQLIAEINRLKAENEQLRNNQTLTGSERQERLQKNQEKLRHKERERDRVWESYWWICWIFLPVIGWIIMVITVVQKMNKSSQPERECGEIRDEIHELKFNRFKNGH